MKNKLTQLYVLASRIDQRHMKFAYFAFVLLASAILRAPADGGGGPH